MRKECFARSDCTRIEERSVWAKTLSLRTESLGPPFFQADATEKIPPSFSEMSSGGVTRQSAFPTCAKVNARRVTEGTRFAFRYAARAPLAMVWRLR